ncbi:MAG: hypothetical protein L3J44_04220 [Campylobacteraceae bacterium]|nr:hypothetical protein [Campylobacteraceae bacterium]
MKKSISLLTSLFIVATASMADDTYLLTYTKDANCTLIKNGKEIPLFDTRFKRKIPKNSYTCSVLQKEQYNNCKILDTKNTTAQVFSFGSYEYTNFIMAFKNPTPTVNSSMEVVCTKKLSKN